MLKVLILGAYGQIAQVATRLFLERTDAQLTLYLRKAKRLKHLCHDDSVRIIEGDVMDVSTLEASMAGQDVVYANLSGNMAAQARNIIDAMHRGWRETPDFYQFNGHLWRGSGRKIPQRS